MLMWPIVCVWQELKIRAGPVDLKLDVSNLASILELKQLFTQACNQRNQYGGKVKPGYIRCFCLGKELKDDLYLYSYDVKEGMTIQAMVRMPEKAQSKDSDDEDSKLEDL